GAASRWCRPPTTTVPGRPRSRTKRTEHSGGWSRGTRARRGTWSRPPGPSTTTATWCRASTSCSSAWATAGSSPGTGNPSWFTRSWLRSHADRVRLVTAGQLLRCLPQALRHLPGPRTDRGVTVHAELLHGRRDLGTTRALPLQHPQGRLADLWLRVL